MMQGNEWHYQGLQEREFVNYIGSSTIYAKHLPMIKVALKTGMRCGELIGLTWSDVRL